MTSILPVVTNLLQSTDEDIVEQSCLIIGNIGGESEICRTAVSNTPGLVQNIVSLLSRQNVSVLKDALWVLSNLLRGDINDSEVLSKCESAVDFKCK